MKKILFCLSFFAVLLLAGQSYASEVAVIDLDEILKNSTVMSKVNKTLENEKAGIEKKLKAEEEKLAEEKNSLESQVKTLSQEVAQQKVLEFQQKILAFQQKVKQNETDLQKKYMDSVIEVTEAIKNIVKEMKNEKDSKYSFDVVLPLSSTIYAESNLDISAEVLSRLNKQLKTVKAIEK